MSQPSLVLFGESFWISPYVFTCYVALKEKGIPFEVRPIALYEKAQQQPDYANASVTGRVPALQHGDFTVAESSAIVEYIEDVFGEGKPMLPRDPKERARARQIMAWIRSDDTLPLRTERSTTSMFYEKAKNPLSDGAQKCVNKLLQVALRVVPDGKNQMFASWSVADADLAFILERLLINDYDLPARLRTYCDAQWSRSSVREFVEQKRIPYVPYN